MRIKASGRDFILKDGYRIALNPPAEQHDDLLLFTPYNGFDHDRGRANGRDEREIRASA